MIMSFFASLLLFSLLFSFLHYLILIALSSLTKPSPPSHHSPTSLPLIGSFIPFYRNRHRLLDWYTHLLAASPTQTITLHRLGARHTVITANPDNVEHILKTNFPNYPKGKPFTDILGDLLGCGIFNADGDMWITQRKLASHDFSTKSLRDLLVAALDSEFTSRLLPLLSSAACTRRPIDLQDILRRFAFDIICKVSLGTDPGFLDVSLPHSPFAAAFDTASGISARRASAPLYAVWKAKRAMRIGSERRLRAAVELIHESVTEIIRHRQMEEEKKETKNDLLSRLIAGGHSDEVIRDMVISFVMAGRDTTSSALTWFFSLISSRPDIEAELMKEIQVMEKLDYNTLKEMKFLEACLCESMRLYPPVLWDSKHADSADVLPDGTKVRKGDRVTYFPYGMGRMERIWGKDWMEYRPERWVSAEGRVSAYKYPVFQAGPRVCLGKDMAFVQMKYVAAAVLGRFAVRRVSGEAPVVVPLLTAHMAGGLEVVVEERRF